MTAPLRDRLIQRARGGDAAAVDLLCRCVPRVLPASIWRGARDEAIRELVTILAVALPTASTHRLARLLADAGAALDAGHRTAATVLPMLTVAELTQVEGMILSVLEWLPPGRDGTRWPKWRSMFAQIAVDRANGSAGSCRHGRDRASDRDGTAARLP